MIRFHFTACLLFGVLACQQAPPREATPIIPAEAIREELHHAMTEQLLHKWYPLSLDTAHGGFLSDFAYDWTPTGPDNKFIVTQARHLWTASKAAEVLPGDPRYRAAADQGFAALRDIMWDSTHGGFFDLLTREGTLPEGDERLDEKRAYGNAFGIYGLAAYFGMSGDSAALDLARDAFHWLETHSHDPVHGGYDQFLTREGNSYRTGYPAPAGSTAALAPKDQNSSIHLMEAFAELYQVWPDSLLAVRLRELLHIVRDTVIGEKPYMQLFFAHDWTPISFQDSSREVIEANHHLDHVSFGHDVETAFLMYETDLVLGGQERAKTLEVGKRVLDHALAYGYDSERGGFYDRGYYFRGDEQLTITEDHKNWWAQAEGMHTLLLFSTLYPEETRYQEAFMQQWAYIQEHLIDQTHGGWYPFGLDTFPEAAKRPKGQIWKGNYHNFRTLKQCLHLLETAFPLQASAQKTSAGH